MRSSEQRRNSRAASCRGLVRPGWTTKPSPLPEALPHHDLLPLQAFGSLRLAELRRRAGIMVVVRGNNQCNIGFMMMGDHVPMPHGFAMMVGSFA